MAMKFSNHIFEPVHHGTDQSGSIRSVIQIPLEHLKPFPDHPFKLYEGQQLEDLIRSIQANGVLTPIIVRQSNDGTYEILAGHNRVNAAREAGLDKIPATVCEPESEEDARILVIESNFNQRSPKDMKHSELANSLYMWNEALKKKPGYRSDLAEAETGSQSDNRSRTMHLIGDRYGLSQSTVARYIRVAQLSPELQTFLDDEKISMSVAVHLSYLRTSEQSIVQQLLESGNKINASQAQVLKGRSREHELSKDEILQIIESKPRPSRKRPIKISDDLFTRYFTEEQSQEDIENIIARALELLRSQTPS